MKYSMTRYVTVWGQDHLGDNGAIYATAAHVT